MTRGKLGQGPVAPRWQCELSGQCKGNYFCSLAPIPSTLLAATWMYMQMFQVQLFGYARLWIVQPVPIPLNLRSSRLARNRRRGFQTDITGCVCVCVCTCRALRGRPCIRGPPLPAGCTASCRVYPMNTARAHSFRACARASLWCQPPSYEGSNSVHCGVIPKHRARIREVLLGASSKKLARLPRGKTK